MNAQSDLDIDLSSDEEFGGAGAPQNPPGAHYQQQPQPQQQLLQQQYYGQGPTAAKGYGPSSGRRMDFSPTPSPPPPPGSSIYSAAATLASVGSAMDTGAAYGPAPSAQLAAPHPIDNSSNDDAAAAAASIHGAAEPINGNDDASENGFVKDGSAESSSVRHASSPAVGAGGTPVNRSRTSIWVHFTRDPDYATNRRGRCVYCHNYYSCSSGSTGNMWRHIKRSHPEKAAQAAPLATHGSHATPQPRADATLASIDNRPRKRQASLSSPINDHHPSAPVSARSMAAPPYHHAMPPPQQLPASQLNLPHTPSQPAGLYRVLEDPGASSALTAAAAADAAALGHIDPTAAGTESLAQALRMLLSITSRSVGPTAQPTAQSLLTSLLESRSAAAPADGLARPPVPSDADAAHSGRGAAVDPASIAHFVAAVGDAIRANAENTAHPQTQAQKTLAAYVDFMVSELVSVDKMLSPGMQQLVAGLGQGGPAPSGPALVAELTRRREAHVQALRKQLDSLDSRVSVSIGTGRVSGSLHYLSMHAHWTDAAFTRHDELLDSHCVDGPPTSGDIISMFEGTLTSYNLFTKLATVTTNYTREFVEFLNQAETICHARGVSFDLDRNQATCIVSSLLDGKDNLLTSLYGVANAGTSADASMDVDSAAPATTPLGRLRAALRAMRKHDAPGSQQLVEICRARGISLSTLDFDTARPWGSSMALLDSTLPIYSELASLPQGSAAAAISPEDWLALSQIRVLFRVLDLTLSTLAALKADFATIVDLVPVYDTLVDNLQSFLQSSSLHQEVRQSAEALREYLAQCHPFQASPIYRMAPLFDPRLKATYYVDHGLDEAWIGRVMRETRSILSEYATPLAAPANASPTSAASQTFTAAVPEAQQGDIRSQIDAFVQLGKPSATTQNIADGNARLFRRAVQTGRTELDEYLSAPLATPAMPVLSWWRIHNAAFPGLSKLAREYLSIPA
ncbi:hypothetical protein GGI15_002400 [Coemansia interrupta]|uniref:BED-type domain-containing protein n=1 Tax=Coemansia interrupta TaxID=1126814 RepID=A0A9W8LLF2_9FUNG|nr:hypothetical protein GGI15_002400 [Coemansia interrupta]